MALAPGIESVVSPSPAGATTCGYCSPPGQRSEAATNCHAAALHAYLLSCSVYQGMIDRGWRRSGTYCYKPNLRLGCCPQYTIRLDTLKFQPTRGQRKLLNRWNRYVLYGESDSSVMDVDESSKSKSCRKGKALPPFTTLPAAIHEAEEGFHNESETAHTFEVTLEPSSYTDEKFQLYKKYQAEIHKDVENSPSGFKRFLVDSPLNTEPIPYPSEPPDHLPREYGSYHQMYRLDGKLIALGVIDILPKCVSSVYFMYDSTWERYSMGKISALRETSLAREIQEAGASEMGYLYMGFYIYSCQKMRYKGDYAPSYLADPETHEWYPLATCTPLLAKHRYACFSDPSHSSEEGENLEAAIANDSQSQPMPSSSSEFDFVNILAKSDTGQLISKPIRDTGYLSFREVRQELGHCIRGLGQDLTKDIVFTV
ncbi:hypothetical protein BDN70DRAFT_432045 [Pholiota conissans]|uniref:arginyltransferase n=1 Tax=Pholiota conissans TaxID=109636 RepID=A0A9P5Z802_9AGAR|nr:hypothetical protein BDN70DRAFT_432045 [Pholiota conissans]